MKIHEDILAGNDPKSWTFSDEIVSVSYSKTEASGQPTFTLQDHDFKATGWKTIIAYDEIHTNKVLKQFFIISLFGGITWDKMSQCPRTDLSKRFLPKQMTTTGWKGTP